jgi:hypothetical protein
VAAASIERVRQAEFGRCDVMSGVSEGIFIDPACSGTLVW